MSEAQPSWDEPSPADESTPTPPVGPPLPAPTPPPPAPTPPPDAYGQQPHGQAPYGQAPYGQQPYGQYPPGYVAQPPVNLYAILSAIFAFVVFPPLGIYFGTKARQQIAVSGERGAELATVGIVAGWVLTGIFALMLVVWCGFAGVFGLAALTTGLHGR